MFPLLPPGQSRNLEVENDSSYYTTYISDSNGNEYDSYSLAWRYLGMYIDCDISNDNNDANDNDKDDKDRRRKLGGSGDNDENDCSRKILWAAYHNPRYRGNQIGEYKFYDWQEEKWDTSTCQTRRCARMDCHEPRTRFKLIGVFKETDGLYDWAEQLFKHQGYCLWDGDKEDEDGDDGDHKSGDEGEDEDTTYDFMQDTRERWVDGCVKMALTDSDGNSLYLASKPEGFGNFTYGLYYDEDCTEDASTTFSEYVIKYYTTYYYDEEKGENAAAWWEATFEAWNYWMNAYKVCQPCRAYNRVPTEVNNNDHGSGDKMRWLKDDENNNDDGGGDEEKWGYNCNDDAGYLNCNQCYKFATKTNLEAASADDLQRASDQGSILRIEVDGVVYGSGGYTSEPEAIVFAARTIGVLVGVCIFALLIFTAVFKFSLHKKIVDVIFKVFIRLRNRSLSAAAAATLKENLFDDDDDDSEDEIELKKAAAAEAKKNEELRKQKDEDLDRLQMELDREKVLRELERSRTEQYIHELEKQLSETASAISEEKGSQILQETAEKAAIRHTRLGSHSSDDSE